MYCKQCGHRTEEKLEKCPKCNADIATPVERGLPPKPKLRWRLVIAAAVVSMIAFNVVPRFFLKTELEQIGPTDKLRFLRALERSEYRRVGQREFRMEGQTLVVTWDLRWNVLPESKQQSIVRIVGRAWHTVGGEDTRFRIEGEDDIVASYRKDEVHLGRMHP